MVGREELFDVFKSDGNAELFSQPTQRKNSTTQDIRSGPSIPHRMVDDHGPSISRNGSDARGPLESGLTLPHQMSDANGPSTTHHMTDAQGPTIHHQLSDAAGPSMSHQLNDAIGPTIHHQISDATGPSTTHQLTDADGPTIHHQLNNANGASTTHPISDTKGPTSIQHPTPNAAGPAITHHWVDADGPSIQHHLHDAVGPVVPRTLENVIVKPPIIQRLFSLFKVGKKTKPADNPSSTEQTIHLDSTQIKMEDRIARVMSAQKETLEKMKALETDSQEIGSNAHSQVKPKSH
jgi:hypothetical protein